MDQDRNLGVTEARFALTIVICLLVAAGYIALMRYGGTGSATVDDGGDGAVVQIDPIPVDKDNSNDPEVLPVDPPTGILSNRPKSPEAPQKQRTDSQPNESGFPESPAAPVGSADTQRR